MQVNSHIFFGDSVGAMFLADKLTYPLAIALETCLMRIYSLGLLGGNRSMSLLVKIANKTDFLHFIGTYLSETRVSAVAVMKTKYRSQFLIERELILSI
jgi:hypothetical protein